MEEDTTITISSGSEPRAAGDSAPSPSGQRSEVLTQSLPAGLLDSLTSGEK